MDIKLFMNEKIQKYINRFISPNSKLLDLIADAHNFRKDIRIPRLETETAALLSWLIRLTKSKNVLEFGTCIGYSAIFMAEAVKENGGHITTIESALNHYTEAKENILKSEYSDVITIINGDAAIEINKFNTQFDFIFQDSKKQIYPLMLDSIILKTVNGGIIAADDTLFRPLGMPEKYSKYTDEYNQLVFNDSRLLSTILPIGSGLTISFKK